MKRVFTQCMALCVSSKSSPISKTPDALRNMGDGSATSRMKKAWLASLAFLPLLLLCTMASAQMDGTTQSASNVTSTSATLNGTITSDGTHETIVEFAWGPAGAPPTIDAADQSPVPATASFFNATKDLSGLVPNTDYVYVMNYRNSTGFSSDGGQVEFFTPAEAPAQPVASNITATSVDIALGSDANATGTQYALYETNTGMYVQSDGSLNTNPSYFDISGFPLTVTGLTPGTGYSFVVYAFDIGSNGNSAASPSADITTATGGCNLITTQPEATHTYCQYEGPTALSVTANAFSYQWYSNTSNSYTGGTALSNEVNDTYYPPGYIAGTMYYYVVVTGACGDDTSDIAEIIVKPAPSISVSPSPACVGSQLTANFSDAATSLDWYKAGSLYYSESPVVNGTYTPTEEGEYWVALTNTDGCTNSSDPVLVSSSTAIVDEPVDSQSVCPGNTADLSFTATGSANSYQWYSNTTRSYAGATEIVGETNLTYTAQPTAAGTTYYFAIATGPCGADTTILAAVTVEDLQVSITSTTACSNHPLTASITGTATKVEWYRNGQLMYTQTPAFDADGITVAGGNGPGSDANQLNGPYGLLVDANKNVYVSDYYNHRIQQWAPGSTAGVTVAGGNGPGNADNQLNSPGRLFINGGGNMYIADGGNNRVQMWAPGATAGVTVAGGNGSGSQLSQTALPFDVHVDASGNIYVMEYANRRVTQWAPGATSGVVVAGGHGRGSRDDQFNGPEGMFIDDQDNIFVADQGNHRIELWEPGNVSGFPVAGGNGRGSTSSKLNAPEDVYVDAAGNIYIADAVNNRIQKWEFAASTGSTVAGGNGKGSNANQLNYPAGVDMDADGNLYVVDQGNNRVQKFIFHNIGSTVSYTPPYQGQYTVVVTSANGCTAEATINVGIGTIVLSQPQDTQAVCLNDYAYLNAYAVGSNISYQWYSNSINSTTGGTLITGETNQDYAPPTNAIGTMYYYAVATGDCDTDTSQVTAVTVMDKTSIPTIFPFCYSDTSITGKTTGEPDSTFILVFINGNPAYTATTINNTWSVTLPGLLAPGDEVMATAQAPGKCASEALPPVIAGNCDNIFPTLYVQADTVVNATGCDAVITLPDPTYSDNVGVIKLTWKMKGATIGKSRSAGINMVGTQTLNAGITTIIYTAVDAAGNFTRDTFNVTVVENQPPTITCTGKVNELAASGCTKRVAIPDAVIADNCGIGSLTWEMTGATVRSSLPTGIRQVGYVTFNVGVTTITYTVTDLSGNTATCQTLVTVTDAIAPTIARLPRLRTQTIPDATACAMDIALANPLIGDNCTLAKVTWAMTGATTDASPATGINYVGTHSFNAGTTTVHYHAEDVSLNSADVSFDVVVRSKGHCVGGTTIIARSPIKDELIEQSTLKAVLFPNPTTTAFALKLQGNEKEAVEVSMYNTSGQKVGQVKARAGETIHFGEALQAGTYMIEVRQGKERVTVVGVKSN